MGWTGRAPIPQNALGMGARRRSVHHASPPARRRRRRQSRRRPGSRQPMLLSCRTSAWSFCRFRFERRTSDYLVSNMVGDFVPLSCEEFSRLAELRVRPGDSLYEKLYAAHLITRERQSAQQQLLALRLRSRMSFLRHTTPLQLFVVTLRCEHSCPCCQVSR
jgi:uncharacterized protein